MPVEWRPLRPSDVPGAFALSRIAGWNQTESDWHGYLAFDPEGCLAALVDGALVGTATCIRYGKALGWIGMVLVHPDHRRLGLGKELLRRTIRYLGEKAVRSIKLDATAAGRKVYLPLGFRDEIDVTRFEGRAPGLPVGPSTVSFHGAAEPMAPGDLTQMAELDARAFGVDRSGVLSSLSSRNPGLCFVDRSGGGISGFLIAREGREAVQMGPMAASGEAVAERLFHALFRVAQGRRLFVDLPMPNIVGAGILARHGFVVQRSFTRMILGEAGPAENVSLVFGTSGAEKG